MELNVILFLALPFLLFFLLQKYTKNGKLPLPPGPRGLPIIGNLFQLDNSAPHRFLSQLSQKFGPLMFLRLGYVPTLVVSSSKMAKEVLKTHDLVFASRPSFAGIKALSYDGLDLNFAPYNDYWREMRKVCVLNLFSAKRVQSFRSVREEEVSLMIQKISKLASDSKVVNLSEMLISLISGIVCRVAFSKRYDGSYERGKFHSLLNEAQFMSTCFFFQDYFPLLGWVDNFTGLKKRLEKAVKELDNFYQQLIDDHLDPKREKPEREDFLDVLLKIKSDGLSTTKLTWDHIKGVLMNVFIAGTDTSAATTVWAMTGLIKNPKAMKILQDEVRNKIGKKGFVDEDDLPNLPYLKAVIKETMRLYPSVPLLAPHLSMQKCTIDGYEIPAKTLVHINAWAIGRDPETWENPDEFLPERFLDNSMDFRGQDFEFIPFGAGRRSCPGIHMGIVAVELGLANLVYAFDWELPVGVKKEDIDTDTAPGTTMHKKNALCLVANLGDHMTNNLGIHIFWLLNTKSCH